MGHNLGIVCLISPDPYDRRVCLVLANLQFAQQLHDLIEFVLEAVQSLIWKANRLICHGAPYGIGVLAPYSNVSSSRVQR